MLRYRLTLIASNVLAVLVLILVWSFVSAELVNGLLNAGNWVAAAAARAVAGLVNFDPAQAQAIMQGAHGGSQIVVAVLAIAIFLLLAPKTLRVWAWMMRTMMTLLAIHIVLDILWLTKTSMMLAWSAGNGAIAERILKSLGWHQIQTLTVSTMASMLVFVEAIIITMVVLMILGAIRHRFSKHDHSH